MKASARCSWGLACVIVLVLPSLVNGQDRGRGTGPGRGVGPGRGMGQGDGSGRAMGRGSREVTPLGEGLFQIGQIRVDTGRREVAVPGTVNQASVLEFVANTVGGVKAYESALTLEADAVGLNTALLLIGLDPSHARVPTQHFDPIPPRGDPLEIWVDWQAADGARHVRVERLLFDKKSETTLPEGPWVYTGSTFLPGGGFLSQRDGVLIGFAHSPSPLIENPGAGTVNRYGFIILNPQLGLTAGSPVTVTIKALPLSK